MKNINTFVKTCLEGEKAEKRPGLLSELTETLLFCVLADLQPPDDNNIILSDSSFIMKFDLL